MITLAQVRANLRIMPFSSNIRWKFCFYSALNQKLRSRLLELFVRQKTSLRINRVLLQIPNPKTWKYNYSTKLRIRDEKIIYLENKVADFESRVDECETYSSKKFLVMENLPITNDINGKVSTLSLQICASWNSMSTMEPIAAILKPVTPESLEKRNICTSKTCHFSAKWMKDMKKNFGLLGHAILTTVDCCFLEKRFHLNSVRSKPGLKVLPY